jgi:hypothetical protein
MMRAPSLLLLPLRIWRRGRKASALVRATFPELTVVRAASLASVVEKLPVLLMRSGIAVIHPRPVVSLSHRGLGALPAAHHRLALLEAVGPVARHRRARRAAAGKIL